jgi:hypothetical protein
MFGGVNEFNKFKVTEQNRIPSKRTSAIPGGDTHNRPGAKVHHGYNISTNEVAFPERGYYNMNSDMHM